MLDGSQENGNQEMNLSLLANLFTNCLTNSDITKSPYYILEVKLRKEKDIEEDSAFAG